MAIRQKLPVIALMVYLAGLIYGGWMPMRFQMSGIGSELMVGLGKWQVGLDQLARNSDVQLNILIFIPIGVLACRVWGVNLFSLLASFSMAATTSAAIEIGQLFEPNRIMTLRDIITNISGAMLGYVFGILLYAPRLKRLWAVFTRRLGKKYGLLGAMAIAAALVIKTGWMAKPTLAVIKSNFDAMTLYPLAGLERFSMFKWITTAMLPYTAITLLLSSRRADKNLSELRIFSAGLCAMAVALLCELVRFITPDEAPATVALLLAAVAVMAAFPLAPLLHRKRLELPSVVLAAEICVTLLLIRVAWSSTGGGSKLPLWGLYKHDFDWGYFAMARRMAFMSAIGFLAAFYFSLKYRWRLRKRAAVAALVASGCAILIELLKLASGHSPNIAGMLENIFAACCGAAFFTICWHLLDRRSSDKLLQRQYIGPERRS